MAMLLAFRNRASRILGPRAYSREARAGMALHHARGFASQPRHECASVTMPSVFGVGADGADFRVAWNAETFTGHRDELAIAADADVIA